VQTLGAKCVGVEDAVTEDAGNSLGRLDDHLDMAEDEIRGIDAVLMAVEHTRAFGHWLHTQNMIVEFQDLCNFQRIALQLDVLYDRK
jgi:hypothetical protein